jgi:hypothetical protein
VDPHHEQPAQDGAEPYQAAGRVLGPHHLQPVYTRVSDNTGNYDSMRRIAGRKLSAHPGLAPAVNEVAIDELLDAGIMVAETLAGAHHAGEVHGDVRAENIVVCGSASVVLLGWAAADAPRSEADTDPRRDIRALGETMYQALLGHPYAAGVDSAPVDGGCPVPPALLAVLLRAMGADAALRYLSADTLAADLRAVRDHRRTPAVASTANMPPRRRLRRLLPIVAAIAVCAGGAWLLGRHTWTAMDGDWQLVVDDHFDQVTASTKSWRASLVPDYQRIEPVAFGRSGWRIVDGVLIGQDGQGRVSNLARTDLPAGAIRATWRITPKISPLNLNCFVGAPNRLDGYTIHVGGWGRPDYVAVTRTNHEILDAATLEQPLQAGLTYTCALEFDRGELSFAIDGRPLLSCRDPEPLGGAGQGGLGFEVSWNTVQIDDLRILVRPIDAIDPLATADALAGTGTWRRAAASYQSFVNSQPQHPLVPTARLRGAVALLRAGCDDEALPLIAEMGSCPDPAVALQARFERLRALAPHVTADVLDGLVARLAEGGPDRTMARLALMDCSAALADGAAATDAEQVIGHVQRLRRWSAALHLSSLDGIFDRWADRLNRLGRHAAVLELMPEATAPNASALLALARYDEVHRRFPGMAWARYMAWSDTCGYEAAAAGLSEPFLLGRLLRESGVPAGDPRITSSFDQAFALAQERGAQAAVQQYPKEVNAAAFAMLGAGRPAEVLALDGVPVKARTLALLQLGRCDEASRIVEPGSPIRLELQGCRAIAALVAGDSTTARRLAIVPEDFSWAYETRWSSNAYDPSFGHHFAAFVLPGLIAWQTAGQDPLPAWQALAAEQTQRCSLRVDHRWQGLLGREDGAAIRAQPFRAAGHPAREAALVAAIRADLAQDPAAAGLWTAYLALASPFDVAARAWAQQRLARLGQP